MKTSNHIQRGKIIAIVSLVLGTLLGWIITIVSLVLDSLLGWKLLGWIPTFGGGFLKIAAWVLMIVAASNLAKAAQSPSLLKSCFLMCLCAIFSELPGIFLFLLGPRGLGSLIAVSLVMAFTIGNIYFAYKYYKEMRTISGVALFFHCFICRAMSVFLSFASVGIFAFNITIAARLAAISGIVYGISLIAAWLAAISGIVYGISLILELVAWITLKEVKILGADFTQAEAALANASPPKTE